MQQGYEGDRGDEEIDGGAGMKATRRELFKVGIGALIAPLVPAVTPALPMVMESVDISDSLSGTYFVLYDNDDGVAVWHDLNDGEQQRKTKQWQT